MRDLEINGGIQVSGVMNIIDNSQLSKLLIHHTNDELVQEIVFRKIMLKKENKRFLKKWSWVCLIGGIVAASAFLWEFFGGSTGLPEYVVSIISLLIPLMNGYIFFSNPPEFIAEHRIAISEAYKLLRIRGAV
jgi:hypothetical protein